MRRNILVNRVVTGVGQKGPANVHLICEKFLEDMKSLHKNYEIINMDETPLYFDLLSNNTIDDFKRGT